MNKLKNIIPFLFKKNDRLGGTAPIYIVVLLVTIIYAGIYFLGPDDSVENNEEENVPMEENSTSGEEKGFFANLIDKIPFIGEKEEVVEEIDTTPQKVIAQEATIDPTLLEVEEEIIEEKEPIIERPTDFGMEQVQVETVGRRDPMRKVVGENVGTYDATRQDNSPADLKDESKNYFGGSTVDDIVLDYVSVDELGDSKIRGDFIVNGSYIPNLEVGDYLLELYYVKGFNAKKKTVTLQFQDKEYILGEQNIFFQEVNFEEENSDKKDNPVDGIKNNGGKN